MRKIKGKKKVKKKQERRNVQGWIIFGVVSILAVAGVTTGLIYTYQSLGLKGVRFSVGSGFYDDDVELEIKPDGFFLTQPIDIKYNMNGDDLENTSELYNGSIKLEVPEEGYKLYTITATACKKDNECTEPEVATYVLGKNLDEDVTIDIININSSQKNLYDYDIGIMVGGKTYDENDKEESDGYVWGNYNNRGKKWMKDAYIIRFDISGQLVWDQVAYIGISGGTSASFETKSMKIALPSKNKHDQEEVFRLHSGSQDQFSGNVRTSIASRLIEESGFDGGTGTKRVVAFLNGDYYGLFNIQQNYSEYNLARKFGIEKEKYIKKHKGSEKNVFRDFGLEDEIWEDLDLTANREKLENLVDMDNYLEYYAIQILLNNTDWPMNNFEAWRYDKLNRLGDGYKDGRIRFLVYDTDLVYQTEDNINWFEGSIGNIFSFLMESKFNGRESSFKKVMESKYYCQKFVELLRELTNGPFATENVLKIVDEEMNKIERQVKLFNTDESFSKWLEQIELVKKAVTEQENEIKNNVKKYFGVEL